MMKKIEYEFNDAMINIYHQAFAEYKVEHTDFLKMVTRLGGLKAALQFLKYPSNVGNVPVVSGLPKVWELIIKPEWSVLFTDKEIKIAKNLLNQHIDKDEKVTMISFHEAMQQIYRKYGKHGYRPVHFLNFLKQHGGLKTAKSLLRQDEYASGLSRLHELGRLDLSVESLVLEKTWNHLFTPEEIEIAKKRLSNFGYEKD